MKKNNYLHEKKFETAVRWGLIHTLTKGRRVLLTIEKLLNKLCLKEFLQREKRLGKPLGIHIRKIRKVAS